MASTGEVWKLGHRPALDGVRGIAVLLVLATHSTELYWPDALGRLGGVGVTVFFTLSGFLITALLLEERAMSGQISLWGFYLRRARRLLPALLAMLTVVGALGVLSWQMIAAVLLYVGNWYGAAGHEFAWVNHTWSLAIEEQFYLLWPLVVMAVASRRALLAVAVTGAAASVLARIVLWDGSVHRAEQIGWWTHTRADALLIGCALALVLHGSRMGRVRSFAAPLVVLTVVTGFVDGREFAGVWLPLVTAGLTALLLWTLVQSGSPGWLSRGLLAWLGRRSYGMYLWHIPVMNTCLAFGMPPVVYAVVAVSASVGIAAASWRWVEAPILAARSTEVLDGEVDRVRGVGVERPVGAAVLGVVEPQGDRTA